MTYSKVLVVANFFFSLVVAGWAMGFYFTSVDWTTNNPESPAAFSAYVGRLRTERGDSGAPTPQDLEEAYNDPGVGRMIGREAHYKQMLAAARPAEANWRVARALVAERDTSRAADRKFYQEQILRVYEPPTNVPAANQQLEEVVLGKDGLPELKDQSNLKPMKDRLQMRPVNDRFGKALHPLAYYAKAHEDNLLSLKSISKDLDDQLTRDSDYTVELEGGTTSGKVVIEKGLRKRIEDERLKGIDMLSEVEIVGPLRLMTYGDSKSLLDLKRQLEARIKELSEMPVSKP